MSIAVEAQVTRTVLEFAHLEIEGITLLSEEEYNRYRYIIPHSRRNPSWWLRTRIITEPNDPWFRCGVRVIVSPPGEEYNTRPWRVKGTDAWNTWPGVRPALLLKPTSGFRPGDKIHFRDHSWSVLSDTLALCDDVLARMPFSRKNKGNVHTNEYEKSSLKKWLDNWLVTAG